MAEKDKDLDLDVKPASNKKLIIIMAIVTLVLVGASVGVTIMMLGGDEEKAAEEVAEEQALPENHYLPLEKMVVNFGAKGKTRFLQVQMELMAHDPAVLKAVEQHMPLIRNDVLVLLGGMDSEQLVSREGKEAMRAEVLTVVQKIVKEQADLEGPQSVYFTNFVMQ